MKDYYHHKFIHFFLISLIVIGFGSCVATKKYHSRGLNFYSIFQSPIVAKTGKINNNIAPFRINTANQNKSVLHSTEIPVANALSQKKTEAFFVSFAKPMDTVFFPEKNRRSRKHRNIFIPHIDEEPNFNVIASRAHNKDDRSWSMFDNAFQLGKLTLIWLVGAIGFLIIIAALGLNLSGWSSLLLLIVEIGLIILPILFLVLGYLYFILGALSLASASATYKKAIASLSPEYKLRGDAVVMHARIPFVSKAKTIKTGKRILKQYPNNYYGEWLQDVSKTLTEIVTKRTSLTIDNWKTVKTLGKIMTVLLLVGLVAFLIV